MKKIGKCDVCRLFIAIVICLMAGFVGSFYTAQSIPTWYADLAKPVLTPPNWVFAPVWTALYILMGVSLYLVLRDKKKRHATKGIILFAVQLILNVLWSVFFFGMRNPALALGGLLALLVVLAGTIIVFHKISKKAAWLLVPYLLWLFVATYLNYSVWILN